MKTIDAILWDNLRKGDKAAFDEIFRNYVIVLFNYGKRFTADEDLIEDCIQDLFTNLWLKRSSLGHTTHIKPYLLTSVKRRLLRQINRAKRNVGLDHFNDFHLQYAADPSAVVDPDGFNDVDRLNEIIGKLTSKQKEVIYLKFFERLPYSEIAQVLGVDVKAVYKLMARALGNLKSDMRI